MRTNINLATQPYEDARRFLAQWTVLLGGLLLLAIVLSYAVVTRWYSYREMSQSVSREKQVLAELDRKQAEDLAILNKAENHDVRERSEFLNGLIRRKEVSWTKIFTDLEKIMPPHVRVFSIEPQLQNDQFLITINMGGDSRDRAAELVRRMEGTKTFRGAQIVNENDGEAGPGQTDPLRFQVKAEYVPAAESAAPSGPAAGAPAPATTAQVQAGGAR